MLLAPLAEKVLPNALLQRLPALGAATVNSHHVPFLVVEIGIEEFGNYVREAQRFVSVAKTARWHSRA